MHSHDDWHWVLGYWLWLIGTDLKLFIHVCIKKNLSLLSYTWVYYREGKCHVTSPGNGSKGKLSKGWQSKYWKWKIAFGSFTCRLLGNFTASVKGTYSKSKAEGISSNNAKEKVRWTEKTGSFKFKQIQSFKFKWIGSQWSNVASCFLQAVFCVTALFY